MPSKPSQDSPLRIGSAVKHSHFTGTGKITGFSHGGAVAIVEVKRGDDAPPNTHYCRTEELKRAD